MEGVGYLQGLSPLPESDTSDRVAPLVSVQGCVGSPLSHFLHTHLSFHSRIYALEGRAIVSLRTVVSVPKRASGYW